MTHHGPTARTLRLPVEDLDLLLDRIEREAPNHHLRADWTVDVEAGWPYEIALTIDLVEARHLQERLGEQSCPALRAISRAFGVPPRAWARYGGGGSTIAHEREHVTY